MINTTNKEPPSDFFFKIFQYKKKENACFHLFCLFPLHLPSSIPQTTADVIQKLMTIGLFGWSNNLIYPMINERQIFWLISTTEEYSQLKLRLKSTKHHNCSKIITDFSKEEVSLLGDQEILGSFII